MKQQFKALPNRKKSGHIAFVKENGKIGFPTINSIKCRIGDVIRGEIVYETDTYFMLRVEEIVEKAQEK